MEKVGKMVLKTETVAERIVGLIGTRRRELNLPFSMELASKFYTLFPKTGDFLALKLFDNK